MENMENNDNKNVLLENADNSNQPETMPDSQPETMPDVTENQNTESKTDRELNSILFEKELDFLKEHADDFKIALEFMDSGDLFQPFLIGDWVFSLVIRKSFPEVGERDDFPIKIYFVKPKLDEICKKYDKELHDIPYKRDAQGNPYLVFEGFKDDFKNCMKPESEKTISEIMISRTKEFVNRCLSSEQRGKVGILGRIREHFIPRNDDALIESKCKKVVLSDRAFMQIYMETQSKIRTETGGLLLGHYRDGVWYVVEASDPGKHGIFEVAYHESDVEYQNHVCEVISRLYKHPLVFLGMWHRHPGSMDYFSGTDDRTNYKYAQAVGNGCISALINYDPDFRITLYYVETNSMSQIKYTKVKIEIGNDKIPDDIMMVAEKDEIKSKYL